jgi:hypothetical protein
VSADILASIDGTLEDWATTQSSADAMRWQPGPFFPLPAQQLDTVRQVCHDTGLDGYAAWLAVADVMDHGEASPYAGFVWPHAEAAQGWQTAHVQVEVTYERDRSAYDRGLAIPERQRRRHRAYARMHGFFWLPCPLCGRQFGGHEWRHIDGKPAAVYRDPADPGHGTGICPSCTRAGLGQWDGIRVESVTCFCPECARWRGTLEETPLSRQAWRLPFAALLLFCVLANAANAWRWAAHGSATQAAVYAFLAANCVAVAVVQGRSYHRRRKARARRKR